jgi:hypothetical protein
MRHEQLQFAFDEDYTGEWRSDGETCAPTVTPTRYERRYLKIPRSKSAHQLVANQNNGVAQRKGRLYGRGANATMPTRVQRMFYFNSNRK